MEEQKPGFLRAFANAHPALVLSVLLIWGLTTVGSVVLGLGFLAHSPVQFATQSPVLHGGIIAVSWSCIYWLVMWLIALITGMAAPPTLRGTGPESGSFSRKEKI